MIPRVGQKVGPYEILGRLGSGGMGLVFSAWDGRLHRDVAIKLLKDEFLNPTMRSRFLGEARAASRLNHPNICTIFDIGEEQDCPYMVMELLKGDTLRGRMQQGAIPVGTIIQVATQVAEALSVAHEHGIIHRDIKPANVVLVDKPNGSFQTKVLDFGLAKVDIEGLDAHSGLTTTGMTVGTVSYMSPEQARGELLDGRSDLFALGVLMYEMATRKLPFDGATSALVFVQLLNHPPEPLRSLNASVPKALEQVVNHCLQKNRDDRYQSGQDLVLALQKAAQNLESGEKSTSWLAKFANGLKRDSISQGPTEQGPETDDVAPETASPPLQMSSDEAFLRPFKPQRQSPRESKHFEPVNAPYPSDIQPSETEVEARKANLNETVAPTVALVEPAGGDPVEAPSQERTPTLTGSGLEWLDPPAEAPPHDEPTSEAGEDFGTSRSGRVLLGLLFAAAIIVMTVAVVLSKKKLPAPHALHSVSILAIADHADDQSLSEVVSSGLTLALQQSPWLGVHEDTEFRRMEELPRKGTSAFMTLQATARAHGTAAFAFGEITKEGASYALTLDVFDSQSGDAVGKCTSRAVSREGVLDAVDSLAAKARAALGESAASIDDASLSLGQMATANIDALLAYQQAIKFEDAGRLIAAADSFERAAALDEKFVQAHLRLAEILYWQHASVAAASEASLAQSALRGDVGTKLLAAGLQSLLATGDLQAASTAFTQLATSRPASEAGFTWLSTVKRLQGDFAGALTSAQQASKLAPSSNAAQRERKLALLALGRAGEVIEEQRTGHEKPSTRVDLLSGFVQSGQVDSKQFALVETEDLDGRVTEAALLDASGQVSAGLTAWREIAAQAAQIPSLVSTASYALSQAELDRALTGECVSAKALEREASAFASGPEAVFALGFGSALCGESESARGRLASLIASYPSSWFVRGFYGSDLNAALQWKSTSFADGIATLQSANQYDQISFNQFLLGQLYLAQRQPQPATVALQASLKHPGALVSTNVELLPLTYLTLGRAFAVNGDTVNSAKAYAQLADVLKSADPDNPMLSEARVGARR